MTGQELPIGFDRGCGRGEPKHDDVPFVCEPGDHHGWRVRSAKGKGLLWAFFDTKQDAQAFAFRLANHALGQ